MCAYVWDARGYERVQLIHAYSLASPEHLNDSLPLIQASLNLPVCFSLSLSLSLSHPSTLTLNSFLSIPAWTTHSYTIHAIFPALVYFDPYIIQGSTKLSCKNLIFLFLFSFPVVENLVQSVRFHAAITFFFDSTVCFVPESKSSSSYESLETILCFPESLWERDIFEFFGHLHISFFAFSLYNRNKL